MISSLSAPHADQRAPSVRRRPWLAVVLSLSPGLGHLYAGYPRAAALIVAVEFALIVLTGWLLYTSFFALAAVLLGALAWRVLVAISARRRARATTAEWSPRALPLIACCCLVFFATGEVSERLIGRFIRGPGSTFHIPSVSMEHTILPGDYLIAGRATVADVSRDELAIYRSADGQSFVHRVVAGSGDTVEMRDAVLFRNGAVVAEPYAWRDSSRAEGAVPELKSFTRGQPNRTYNWGPTVVPPRHHVLLGDNRGNSLDSRYRGFIADSQVTHRPLFVYFSFAPDSGVRWNRIGRTLEP